MDKLPPYQVSTQASSADQAHQSDNHFDSAFHAYAHIIVKRKLLVIATIVAGILLAFFLNLTQLPVFEAASELVIEPKLTGEAGQEASASNLLRDPTFLMTQQRMLKSDEFGSRVVDSLEKKEQLKLLKVLGVSVDSEREKHFELRDQERQRMANFIRGRVSLSQVSAGARILKLSVESYDPQLCAAIANAASEVYVLLNHESHIQMFQKRFAMTNRSLNEIREKIKASELALEKVNAEIKLFGSLKVFDELYPEVVSLRQLIRELSQSLTESQKSLKQGAFAQRQDAVSVIINPHLELAALSPIQNDLNNLQALLEQEISTNKEIYNSIYKRIQEMELTGGTTLWIDIKVIQYAGAPSSPIKPNKKMNLFLGILLGIVAGISLAFFIEYLDSSIRGIDDIKAYMKSTALGLVPEVEFETDQLNQMKTKAKKEGANRIMWSTGDGQIPLYVAEAYRIIRTNLVFGAVDKSLKVFQLTSAVKGEGKTTTTVNLGISLAQVGMNVLIVDADLRRPSLHRALHLDLNSRGLYQLLTGDALMSEVALETGIPNLSVIVSGGIPQHPAELLSSSGMRRFLEEARKNYDVILVDSPPVISVADAPVIASHVDGTILVIRAGYIPRRLNFQAKRAIEAVNGKILGMILNGVSSAHHPYYYYRYYNDRYYTYGDQTAGKNRSRRKSPMHIDEEENFITKLMLLIISWMPGATRRKKLENDLAASPTTQPDRSKSPSELPVP